jgi:TRAP-type C4-dicarboxylate transport system substrate-binding protein
MRTAVVSTLVLALAMVIPGSTRTADAAADTKIRIATLAPRTSELVRGFNKINHGLKKRTGGQWSLQLYPSGIAGDETDVIRKMRVGQMDATAVTSVGLSQVLKELAVLTAPGVIPTYEALERVQKVFNKEWETKLNDNGFRLMGWGEVGLLRYFSKAPVTRPSDLKQMRPWVWPQSHTMKAMWHATGCTGVPLGVPEVYGALQTGMVDSIISTALAAVALQWHSKLNHVTKKTFGPLVGGLVIAKAKWDTIPPDVQTMLAEEIKTSYEGDSREIRKDDEKAFKRLLERGYTSTPYTAEGEKEYEMLAKKARESLVGRVYSRELLDRVIQVAASGGS